MPVLGPTHTLPNSYSPQLILSPTHTLPNSYSPQLILSPTHTLPNSYSPQLILSPTHTLPNSYSPQLILSPTHTLPNSYSPQLILSPTHTLPNSYSPQLILSNVTLVSLRRTKRQQRQEFNSGRLPWQVNLLSEVVSRERRTLEDTYPASPPSPCHPGYANPNCGQRSGQNARALPGSAALISTLLADTGPGTGTSS